jgi:hypothetical protein
MWLVIPYFCKGMKNGSKSHLTNGIGKTLLTALLCIILFLSQGYISLASIKLATATTTEQLISGRIRSKKGVFYKNYRSLPSKKITRAELYQRHFEWVIKALLYEIKSWFHQHHQLGIQNSGSYLSNLKFISLYSDSNTSQYDRIGLSHP